MLRTLPSRHFAELEELLPKALSNCTMVNGLECKLSNRSSKVSFLMPAVINGMPDSTTVAVIHTVYVAFPVNLGGVAV